MAASEPPQPGKVAARDAPGAAAFPGARAFQFLSQEVAGFGRDREILPEIAFLPSAARNIGVLCRPNFP